MARNTTRGITLTPEEKNLLLPMYKEIVTSVLPNLRATPWGIGWTRFDFGRAQKALTRIKEILVSS